VSVTVESLGGGCAAPQASSSRAAEQRPKTLGSKKKMNVFFDVTFTCANDPLKSSASSPGHEDFRYTVVVNRSVLGGGTERASCGRPLPARAARHGPHPDGSIRDKGCGGRRRGEPLRRRRGDGRRAQVEGNGVRRRPSSAGRTAGIYTDSGARWEESKWRRRAQERDHAHGAEEERSRPEEPAGAIGGGRAGGSCGHGPGPRRTPSPRRRSLRRERPPAAERPLGEQATQVHAEGHVHGDDREDEDGGERSPPSRGRQAVRWRTARTPRAAAASRATTHAPAPVRVQPKRGRGPRASGRHRRALTAKERLRLRTGAGTGPSSAGGDPAARARS
jgi:hypothetical protein